MSSWNFRESLIQYRSVLCDISICHLHLCKRIDVQGVRNEHLNSRFFTIASNGEICIIDHSCDVTDMELWSGPESSVTFAQPSDPFKEQNGSANEKHYWTAPNNDRPSFSLQIFSQFGSRCMSTSILPCWGRTPYEHSRVAKFPLINYVFLTTFMHIFLWNFQTF